MVVAVSTDDGGMTSSSVEVAFTEAIERARRGEREAIELLFVELQPRLLRFLVAQESRAADDLSGEVWLAVATHISTFEGDWADFRAWFFTIARHRLADYRRTATRRRTDVVDVAQLDSDGGEDIEKRAVDTVSGQEAAKLITSVLGGDQAEVILLRVLADLDVDQVAAIMQRPANWVRVTQFRALRTLARRLGPKLTVMR